MTPTMPTPRPSPLHKQLEAVGATFAAHGDRLVASSFGVSADEVRAAREGVAILDRNDRGLLTVAGPDATRFLQGMVTNDVEGLKPGQGNYACHLNVQGQIQADFHLYAMADHFLLDVDASRTHALAEALNKYIIADQVEIANMGEQLQALSLIGPSSAALLIDLGAATTSLHGSDYQHSSIELNGATTVIVRLDEIGGPGFRLICTHQNAPTIWDALLSAQGDNRPVPIGHAALNVLRTEAGIPWTGAELTDSTLPPEARIERSAVSYDKGCYIGQEIIERIRSRGNVNRLLCGLVLDKAEASNLPTIGAPLTVEEKSVGTITTAVHSPTLGRNIALGYLRREHSQPGTVVDIGPDMTAAVSELPFTGS